MNKQVILKKRPEGMPEADTWALESNPIPEVGDG
ncbi:MAG: NADPH-dependent curcumin reductase CurA, partial [Saprospiraceae bacterium]